MILRPRLTDYHGVHVSQENLDFVIPFLDEDVPLCIDPFLLWRSPSQHYNALHVEVITAFNKLAREFTSTGNPALTALVQEISECSEIGLGFSRTRKGAKISETQALAVLSCFNDIPDLAKTGFTHIEILQGLVDGIGKDRISDFSANVLKSFLIDYTMEQCRKVGIPLGKEKAVSVFRPHKLAIEQESVALPENPTNGTAMLLVPKHWLRRGPWISNDDYFEGYLPKATLDKNISAPARGQLLLFNRHNYGVLSEYVAVKERTAATCQADPIFTPLPLLSLKGKLKELRALQTGKGENADRRYEDLAGQLLITLLFPHLDFACEQARTDSGAHIRDVVFYNNRTIDFLDEILAAYKSRQLVFELKNVREIEREHVNQLNRYLSDSLGLFGVIVTRNPPPRSIERNVVDLWSAQRRSIVFITDEDLDQMVTVFESKQRFPLEVVKKKYVEFRQSCPT